MCGFGVPYGTGASGRIARRLILLGVYFPAVGTMGTLEQPHFGHAADNAKASQTTYSNLDKEKGLLHRSLESVFRVPGEHHPVGK